MIRTISRIPNRDDTMTIARQHAERVQFGNSLRPIDPAAVDQLVESFKVNGCLEPLLVTCADGLTTIIAGHHRWTAALKFWKEQPDEDAMNLVLPCRIISLNKEHVRAVQIAENLHRNELTPAQRATMAAEYGQAILGEVTKPTTPAKSTARTNSWFAPWYEATSIPKQTAFDLWKAYCAESGCTFTPAKAANADKQNFFAWVKNNDGKPTKKASAENPEIPKTPQSQKPAESTPAKSTPTTPAPSPVSREVPQDAPKLLQDASTLCKTLNAHIEAMDRFSKEGGRPSPEQKRAAALSEKAVGLDADIWVRVKRLVEEMAKQPAGACGLDTKGGAA